MNPSRQIRFAAILALEMFVLAQPQTFGKGKPGGGGGEPPASSPNPVIALHFQQRNKPDKILLANEDGSNATVIYPNGDFQLGGDRLNPAFWSDGGQIVFHEPFTTEDGEIRSGLWALNYSFDSSGITADPESRQLLDHFPRFYWIWALDISPDGKYALYWLNDPSDDQPKVRLCSTDPDSTYEPRWIHEARAVSNGGLVWLQVPDQAAYKIALVTESPDDPSESEILVYTIDPTAPADQVIADPESPDATFSSFGKPYQIGGSLKSARTSESLVIGLIYREATIKTGPILVNPRSVALWHIQPDAVEELTNPLERIGEGLLSPFDDRLMYNADGEVVVLDLVSGQREVIYSGSNTGAVDWLPVARPILETP